MTTKTATKTSTKTDVVPVSREVAEHMDQNVKKAAQSVVHGRKMLTKAIKEAKESNAWKVLGHRSWTDYLGVVFSKTAFPRMAKADLEWLMGMMGNEGVSSRVVAEVTGTSQSTASRVVRKAKAEKVARGEKVAQTVTTRDGKTQKATKAKTPAKESAKETPAAVKAAKAYAAAVKRLTESGDFDLATLDADTAAEVAAILADTRSNMVRASKALSLSAKALKVA